MEYTPKPAHLADSLYISCESNHASAMTCPPKRTGHATALRQLDGLFELCANFGSANACDSMVANCFYLSI